MTEKFYLALKCLLAAHRIDATHPTTHQQTLRLRHALASQNAQAANGGSAESSSEALTPLDLAAENFKSPYSFKLDKSAALNETRNELMQTNEEFYKSHPESLPHLLAYLIARQDLDDSTSATESNRDHLAKAIVKDLPPKFFPDEACEAIRIFSEQLHGSREETIDLAQHIRTERPGWRDAEVLTRTAERML